MKTVYALFGCALAISLSAQTPPDIDALETIIVEKYYVAGPSDVQEGILPEGATTYRIFVDMKPGYELQMVTGQTNHPITLQTDGQFYNTETGTTYGSNLLPFLLNFGTTALDSYVCFGAAAQGYIGVPKSMDTDGSILTGAEGFLQNVDPSAGESILVSDGLMLADVPAAGVLGIENELNDVFGLSTNSGVLTTENGVWFNLDGLSGPTDENIVMIGQFTTTECDFSFELNFQVLIPEELRTDQRVGIIYVAVWHPSNQVINDSGDNYLFYQKDDFIYEAECLPISTVDQGAQHQSWKVMPNPSNGSFSVTSELPLTGAIYNVFDLQGRLLFSKHSGNLEPNSLTELDIMTLPEGIYLLQLQTADGQISSKRIVKTN